MASLESCKAWKGSENDSEKTAFRHEAHSSECVSECVSYDEGNNNKDTPNHIALDVPTDGKIQDSSGGKSLDTENHPTMSLFDDQKQVLLGLGLHDSTGIGIAHNNLPASTKVFQFISSEKGDEGQYLLYHKPSDIPQPIQTHVSFITDQSVKASSDHKAPESLIQDLSPGILMPTRQASVSAHPHSHIPKASQMEYRSDLSTCPVHNVPNVPFITYDEADDFLAASVTNRQKQLLQKAAHMPLDRYLAEGVAERYALLGASYSERGSEWARCSRCLCYGAADVK